MNTITFTRADYMNGKCDHATYYGQFATDSIVQLVQSRIGAARIKASTDDHLNDIPLREWDSMAPAIGSIVGRALGESNASMYAPKDAHVIAWSLADCVCVAKQAAAKIRNQSSAA